MRRSRLDLIYFGHGIQSEVGDYGVLARVRRGEGGDILR